MKIIYWFFLFLILASCHDASRSAGVAHLPYFDLSGYLATFVQDSLTGRVEKSITINGTQETQLLEHYPIWKDLQDFSTFDINRPALFDKYSIDTIYQGDNQQISYRPLENHLKVQHLVINLQQEEVTSIEIRSVTNSFLDDVQVDIILQPNQGYTIDRKSKRILKSDGNRQVVQVKVL